MEDGPVTHTSFTSAEPNAMASHFGQSPEATMSLNEEENGWENEEDTAQSDSDGNFTGTCQFEEAFSVNGMDDIATIDFQQMNEEQLMLLHFPNDEVAFMVYQSYAVAKGFSARRSKLLRNINNEKIQQSFVCHREGRRSYSVSPNNERQRRTKPLTRCGCKAKCIVHIEHTRGRWYVKTLFDGHNHSLMDKILTSLLPAHRAMPDYDKFQMVAMRKAGVKTSQIYGYLADQAGGHEKLGYIKRDMYNEQVRQKRSLFTDAQQALDLLAELKKKDEFLVWKHTVDGNGRLEHLFWADGVGRGDFKVFGDVLAFDATYKKNTYLCPFVVFSGVNHHNQSIVFATAIIGNELEETYVWLLEQFLAGMDGKSPISVITDGCPSMRNAIKKVLPASKHRLCAWHLLKNATKNIKNPKFVPRFRQCMLGDYEVMEFESMWEKLVEDFGLQGNKWMKDMYEKRHMWAAAHIRGNFFAGFRTTSRCESLNSEFGKYVGCQDNLLEFMQNYFRWLNGVRFREVEAVFETARGDIEIETQLRSLEKSAADVYTREVFLIFRPLLQRSLTFNVVAVRDTGSSYIFTICKYGRQDKEWRVIFSRAGLEFKCSCMKLESIGIPCEHIVIVMVHLNIVNMPECVIYKRWTKAAKDGIGGTYSCHDIQSQPEFIYQYMGLVERGKRLAKAAVKSRNAEHMRNTIEIVEKQTKFLESLCTTECTEEVPNETDQLFEGPIRNPLKARHKGCGVLPQGGSNSKNNRSRRCGVCRNYGHTRKSCYLQKQLNFIRQDETASNQVDDEYDLSQTGVPGNIEQVHFLS